MDKKESLALRKEWDGLAQKTAEELRLMLPVSLQVWGGSAERGALIAAIMRQRHGDAKISFFLRGK